MCADAIQPDPPPAPQEGQPPPAPLTEEQEEELALPLPQRLAREFHRQVFSARITLSAYDMQSLDGRTITGTEVMRDQMQDLIEGESGGTP
jgi:hypothetical protein